MLLDDEEKRFPSACAESKAGRVGLFAARTAEHDLSILPQPVVLSGSTHYGHRMLVRPLVIVA